MSISCHAQELLDSIRLILSRSSCASTFADSFGKKSVSPCHLELWTALSSLISFIGCLVWRSQESKVLKLGAIYLICVKGFKITWDVKFLEDILHESHPLRLRNHANDWLAQQCIWSVRSRALGMKVGYLLATYTQRPSLRNEQWIESKAWFFHSCQSTQVVNTEPHPHTLNAIFK